MSMEVEYVDTPEVKSESPEVSSSSKPKKKSKVIDHVEDGDVLVVDKSKLPPKKEIIEISHKQAELMRPKKELTEKQKVALQALIERNKKRFEELRRSKDVVKNPEELSEIDEDKEIVVVKPKRAYNKKEQKKKVVVVEESSSESEEEEEESNSQYLVSQLIALQKKVSELESKPKEQPKVQKVHKYSGLSIF